MSRCSPISVQNLLWVYQLKGQCFQVCTWRFHHGWLWCCCSSLSFSLLEWSTVCPEYPCYTMSSDSGAFYCSRLRPGRLVTYLEALETAEEEPHVDHFTLLPPRFGDVGDHDAESDLEDVPDDLENEDGFEAAGENSRSNTAMMKSRKVETLTLILNLLASVFVDKTFRVGENVQASTFLWMILAFKLTLTKSFPTSPHSLHFAFRVKSSHLPSWITSWSKPTCMHSATAMFLHFRPAKKIFRPSLASFCCRAIIIFPKKTIIDRTVKISASQLFQRQ